MRGHKPRADPTGVGRGVLPQLSGPGPQGCSRNRQLVSGATLAEVGSQAHGVRWRPAYRHPFFHSLPARTLRLG